MYSNIPAVALIAVLVCRRKRRRTAKIVASAHAFTMPRDLPELRIVHQHLMSYENSCTEAGPAVPDSTVTRCWSTVQLALERSVEAADINVLRHQHHMCAPG